MTSTLQAHYDGRVIVPDEPVDLPIGQVLEIQVRTSRVVSTLPSESERETAWQSFISRTVQGANIPDEALRREALYEDED